MQGNQFSIVQLDKSQGSDRIEQLVGLMTRMYDFHASLHPDWQAHPNWQEGSKQWLSRVSDTGDWFAALAYPQGSQEACGYIFASFHYEAPLFIQHRFGYIPDLWVNEEYRGQGAAELLLEAAYEWFNQQGVERLQLEVDLRNERAHHFWQKQGFEDFEMVMRRDLK